MDYFTRRSVAACGHLSVRLAGLHAMRWPRLSSLGVRVEFDGALVCVEELRQALADIGEKVELPTEERVSAELLEPLLIKFEPFELDNRICSFLWRLTEEAERGIYLIHDLPEIFQEPFRQWLGGNIIRIEGGEEGYHQVDLEKWMDDLREKHRPALPCDKVRHRERHYDGFDPYILPHRGQGIRS